MEEEKRNGREDTQKIEEEEVIEKRSERNGRDIG